MEQLSLLHRRRSIRKYTAEAVSPEAIEAMLRAAMAAPSAHNQQPWHFVVVRDRATLDELAKVHRYSKMLAQAPLCVVPCGEKEHRFWEQDCSAATQNLLLAATALGLGAVWVGIHPNAEPVQKVRELLQIPETHVPLCLIPIGHPAEERQPSERYTTEKVHSERW